MPVNTRQEAARWTLSSGKETAQPSTEDYFEDADYTAPVKKDDAEMIQFLTTRAKKSAS